MRKQLAGLCLALGAFSGGVHAAGLCDRDPFELSSPERLECSTKAAEQAERDMRNAYGSALRSLTDRSLKGGLNASQQAWTRYRKLQCDYLRDAMGEATEALAWHQGCMQDMAKERVKWLKASRR